MAENKTKKVIITTEYTVRKEFEITVPIETDIKNIEDFDFDFYDEEISTENEDAFWESNEIIVYIKNKNSEV